MPKVLIFLLLLCVASVRSFAPTAKRLDLSPRVDRRTTPPCTTTVCRAAENGSDESSSSGLSLPDLSALVDKITQLDVGQVISNIKSGEIGQRGEVYVIGQFALIFFILIGSVPVIGNPLRAVSGPALLLGGIVVSLLGVGDLKSDSLTPFLTPTDGGTLKEDGIYASIRHPMYAGLIAGMAGLSILTNSADRLLLTVALYALLDIKASMEEAFLKEKYPEYEKYMKKVQGKFLPADLIEKLKQPNK